jgi:hypothetical protein
MTERTEGGNARPMLLDRATLASFSTRHPAGCHDRQADGRAPDSTASAALPAGMAGCVKDLIADTAKSS